MTKEEYRIALNTPEWRDKRSSILRRDRYTCKSCNSTENLHVHHKHYIQDKMPWEVPDSYLVTLCESCHDKEHEGKKISSFIIKRKKQKPPGAKKKGMKKSTSDRLIKMFIRNYMTKDEKDYVKQKGIEINAELLLNSDFVLLRSRVKVQLKNTNSIHYKKLRHILSQMIYL